MLQAWTKNLESKYKDNTEIKDNLVCRKDRWIRCFFAIQTIKVIFCPVVSDLDIIHL